MKVTAYNNELPLVLAGAGGIIVSNNTRTSLGSNTPLIESGAGSPGSGPQAAAWDHVHPEFSGGGSVSFGSNSTRVASVSSAGASSSNSRADHVHDGIGTLTASSSNTLVRGTVNLRAGTGIAFDLNAGLDTLTIQNIAAGGGGGGMTNPMTTEGDVIVGGASGTPTRLAAGATSGHVLTSNGSGAAPSWQASGGGGSGASWTQVINESGASFANFTASSGTWASNGTEITQTNTAGTWRRARYNTLLPIGYPLIMELEAQILTATGRAAIGLTDGTNAAGLAIELQQGSGIQIDIDAQNTIRTITATINTSTWYKLRVVMGNTWMISTYLDGVLKGNTAVNRNISTDIDPEYITLLTINGSILFRNIKAWLLTGGAPA